MPPSASGQRDYDDPIYDEFWEDCIELRLPLVEHFKRRPRVTDFIAQIV